jgi:hypothetical protein
MKNLQLFAEEVMPKVQPVFGEWDASHYWPSGFAEDAEQAGAAQRTARKEPAPAFGD